MILSDELDQIKEIVSAFRAAPPFRSVCITEEPSGGSDALMERWLNGRRDEIFRWMTAYAVLWSWWGVDVWYPPARTAPVRLLVEAEASPAFLRRARVCAQCTACTKQAGGKAKTVRSRRGGRRVRETEERDKQRKKETQSSLSEQEKAQTLGLFVQRKPSSQDC